VGTITYHLFRDGTLVWSGIATDHRDVGLSNGQTYEYKVAASNDVGWGPNCTAEFATTSGVPDSPWGLTWEAGNSQVALSWNAVNYSGPGILIYHLFRDGVEVWNGTSTIHIDTGLVNGKEYEYNVVASNSFGWGQLSATVKATPVTVAPDNTLLYIGIGVIAIALVLVAVQFLRKREKTIPPNPNPPMQATSADIPQITHCEYCKMEISADSSLCPFCGTIIRK
jgi:hypothetical protein